MRTRKFILTKDNHKLIMKMLNQVINKPFFTCHQFDCHPLKRKWWRTPYGDKEIFLKGEVTIHPYFPDPLLHLFASSDFQCYFKEGSEFYFCSGNACIVKAPWFISNYKFNSYNTIFHRVNINEKEYEEIHLKILEEEEYWRSYCFDEFLDDIFNSPNYE